MLEVLLSKGSCAKYHLALFLWFSWVMVSVLVQNKIWLSWLLLGWTGTSLLSVPCSRTSGSFSLLSPLYCQPCVYNKVINKLILMQEKTLILFWVQECHECNVKSVVYSLKCGSAPLSCPHGSVNNQRVWVCRSWSADSYDVLDFLVWVEIKKMMFVG